MHRRSRASLAATLSLLVATSVTASEGLHVAIEKPDRDSIIASPMIYVSGIAIAPSRNFGITVNGVPAWIDIERAGTRSDPFRWFAEVPATPGKVKLKARLTTDRGESTSDAEGPASVRFVHYAPSDVPLHLTATPKGGLAPLAATLTVSAGLTDVAKIEIDFNGDGVVDASSDGATSDFSHTYQSPGLHVTTVKVTTADGNVVQAAAAVAVYSLRTIDAILQETWTGFYAALRSGSPDAALTYIASGEPQEKYRGPLHVIKPGLPAFAETMKTIRPVSFTDRVAHYLLTREEGGEVYGYHVYFTRDANGVWKILQF